MKYIFMVIIFMISPIVLHAQLTKEEITDNIQNAIAQGGIEKAIDTIQSLHRNHPDSTQTILSQILRISADHFSKGSRPEAIELLEKSKPIFPNHIGLYSVLGQFYWYEYDRGKCIANFKKALEIDPKNKMANNYLDILFFVPEDFRIPDSLSTENLFIRPLRTTDVELDYHAVMSSINHIRGVFGPDDDWPQENLTLEDDLRALKNHEVEFKKRVAFTYTVMDTKETECLGCVYILPIHAEQYDAQIFLWVTFEAFKKEYDKELYLAVRKWVEEDWPFTRVAYPGREVDWETYHKIQE